MKRQESDRFDDDRKEEPYHHQHDSQGFRPHATGGDGGIHHQNVGFGGGGGGFRGFSRAQFPRKRNFSSSDCPDGSDIVKLFVGGIARTTTEEEIRRMFEKYGDIIEIVMVQDKKTSKQHEYCFVKYLSMEAADRAIAALNNEFLFPGGTAPIRVRFADGERERIVAAEIQHKLYVSGLNKQASKDEIIEIFTSYGLVEDVYLLLDDLKQRRGCGFITFSHREMAVAAINGLHGTYVMKGCDQSLVVRFADPKKPRIRELREAPDSRDFHGGTAPGSFHFGNLGAPPYENAAIMGAEAPPPFANMIQPPSSSVIHQLNHHQAIPFQIPSVQGQGWNGGSQPFNGTGSEVQTALNHGNILLLGDSCMAIDQSSDSTSQRQMVPTASVETNGAVSSSLSASSGVARCDSVEDARDCDWSEHTCPDGYKYYFNCMTYESRWEKPKEFTLYEEQLHKSEQQLRSLSGTQVQPLAKLDVLSDEQSSLVQAMECQSGSLNGLKLMSCAEEHIQEKSTADADLVISPALVQQ